MHRFCSRPLLDARRNREPKTGTTFMYHWVHGALMHTCNFLNRIFGGDACAVEEKDLERNGRPQKIVMTFDPHTGGRNAKCSCQGVDRWDSVADSYFYLLIYVLYMCWSLSEGVAFSTPLRIFHFCSFLPRLYWQPMNILTTNRQASVRLC